MVRRHINNICIVFILVTFIFTGFPLSLFNPPVVHADSGFIDPNGNGSTGAWTSTGASFYTEVDEAIRQPTAPTITDYVSGAVNNAGNIHFRMNSITSVSSATQIVVWVYHNDGSNGVLTVQLVDDDETTTRSSTTALPQRAANTWDSATFSSLSLTQAQLNTLTVRIIPSKSGGGAPATARVYALYGAVTYTPQAAVSISLSTDGTVAFGGVPLNTTKDTTASGTNDVQTVSVDSGPANIDIRSTTFSDGSNTWALGSGNGADQVQWEYSSDGTLWDTFLLADTLYVLGTNVAQGNTKNAYFRLTLPTTSTSYSQYSSTVTIVASAP